ncbi:hypothetical protein PR048_024589 [Dryococelus australis]|uniref:Reverse transcriptase n=1 Tax=Dryococelus australis TaxID=614101 RepID=A0ABQ9GNZ4_9NEOP|nr:hypothetical protein PR048_024589 [Dryococelus australis]
MTFNIESKEMDLQAAFNSLLAQTQTDFLTPNHNAYFLHPPVSIHNFSLIPLISRSLLNWRKLLKSIIGQTTKLWQLLNDVFREKFWDSFYLILLARKLVVTEY